MKNSLYSGIGFKIMWQFGTLSCAPFISGICFVPRTIFRGGQGHMTLSCEESI